MNRPQLNELPMPIQYPERGRVYITMSPGQWDILLDEAYKAGHTLLEIEDVCGYETITHVYRFRK